MLNITPVNALSDNYVWIVQRDSQPQVVIIDPTQAEPVLKYIHHHQLTPVAILITHQHYDHTGGVADILKEFPYISVIGPGKLPSKTPLKIDLPIQKLITFTVGEGDAVFIPGTDFKFEVIEIPGHTLDHLAYLTEDVVFCGDTLFAAGCGRLFSGTPQMMTKSLARLGALPPKTLMYCSHEYTVDNLGFAKWVEPESRDIMDREQIEMARQDNGEVTLPTNLALELSTNPFMRLQQPVVKQAAETFAGKSLTEDWEVFVALREWKDTKYD
jgi:hydroxyacylglutathione hydrolase